MVTVTKAVVAYVKAQSGALNRSAHNTGLKRKVRDGEIAAGPDLEKANALCSKFTEYMESLGQFSSDVKRWTMTTCPQQVDMLLLHVGVIETHLSEMKALQAKITEDKRAAATDQRNKKKAENKAMQQATADFAHTGLSLSMRAFIQSVNAHKVDGSSAYTATAEELKSDTDLDDASWSRTLFWPSDCEAAASHPSSIHWLGETS